MANYKETEKRQGYIIPVVLSEQIVEGTYEHMLENLIDNKLDLRIFDKNYWKPRCKNKNDETGVKVLSSLLVHIDYQ